MGIAARIRAAWPRDRASGSPRRPYSAAHHRYAVELARWWAGERATPPTPPPGLSLLTAHVLEELARWAACGNGARPPDLYP